ncbi:MAG: hypothetical protein ACYDCK_04555 [Thermoplasmatota archaeon]
MRWKMWLGVPLIGLGFLTAFVPDELRTRSQSQFYFGRYVLIGIVLVVAGFALLVSDLRDRLREAPPPELERP